MAHERNFAKHLLAALDFAAEKHRDQRRKGIEASPYINHPIQVAEVLANHGGVDDKEALMAAVLHDTIEDTEATHADLAARFGTTAADLVLEVTDEVIAQAGAQALAGRACREPVAPGQANQDRRQDLQRTGYRFETAGGLEHRSPTRVLRLGRSRGHGANPALEAYFDECVARSREKL